MISKFCQHFKLHCFIVVSIDACINRKCVWSSVRGCIPMSEIILVFPPAYVLLSRYKMWKQLRATYSSHAFWISCFFYRHQLLKAYSTVQIIIFYLICQKKGKTDFFPQEKYKHFSNENKTVITQTCSPLYVIRTLARSCMHMSKTPLPKCLFTSRLGQVIGRVICVHAYVRGWWHALDPLVRAWPLGGERSFCFLLWPSDSLRVT